MPAGSTTSSRTAATGDSARRKWSASGRRPRALRSRVSGSGSATSACSSGRTTLESAMWIVGVDVGGTTTAAGGVTEGGEVVADVTALARGAWMFGAARGAASLVGLAAGTGVGGGIVLDGHLVRGAGFGGELGHTPVKFDGPPCFCGGRGCLAIYASGRGIADAARARIAGEASSRMLAAAGGDPTAITAAIVFRAAAEGDPIAASVVDEACRALGATIGTIVNGLNPEVIVITGGVARSLAPLEARILGAAR